MANIIAEQVSQAPIANSVHCIILARDKQSLKPMGSMASLKETVAQYSP